MEEEEAHQVKDTLEETLTSNPNWPEIQNELLPHQTPTDCPDLVAQVFHLYQTSLIDDLTQCKIIGNVLAHVHCIEFQKHGLPHMHMLLSLLPRF